MLRTPLLVSLTWLLILACYPHGATPATVTRALERDSDPVVMAGDQLPAFLGTMPGHIVAFRYAAGWVQVPVQVDERAWVDFGDVYGMFPTGIVALGYCDPNTYMGPDPEPMFDADDELVFMAADTGDLGPAGFPPPAGAQPGTRVDVVVTDPLAEANAYLALYLSDGTLFPDAGADYVAYDFVLLSGDYLTTYNTAAGPNPEDSQVVTASYRMHFSDRWIRDEVNVYEGSATGADILDRHKNLFAPENCARSEDTFSAGEGAFFASKDGCVRAIRSYIGANSGPFTQRDHFFYARRHDVRTYLRVHAISGIMDFYDYSPAATGMVYANDLNLDGVVIDGVPSEFVAPGSIIWEMVTGTQGTLACSHLLETDIPAFTYRSYYLDEANTTVQQCTGDDHAYGSSGLWIDHEIPNTDPYLGAHNILVATRIVYLEEPDQTITMAQERYAQATHPLVAEVLETTLVSGTTPTSSIRLAQNVPNPFNPLTYIAFELPVPGHATLEVYDLRGRLVRRLLDAEVAAGGHRVSWNGTDTRGREVAAGNYLYRLRSSSQAVNRTMTLVR